VDVVDEHLYLGELVSDVSKDGVIILIKDRIAKAQRQSRYALSRMSNISISLSQHSFIALSVEDSVALSAAWHGVINIRWHGLFL